MEYRVSLDPCGPGDTFAHLTFVEAKREPLGQVVRKVPADMSLEDVTDDELGRWFFGRR